MPVEPGQQLAHYRLIEQIGQGGMGEVYLADDASLQRKVALKFLPSALADDQDHVVRSHECGHGEHARHEQDAGCESTDHGRTVLHWIAI